MVIARRINALIFVLLLVLVISVPAYAQSVPQLIRLQGFLTDAADQPLNADVNMTFDLYDAATAGTLINTISPGLVTVVDGLYDVNLAFTPSDFAGASRYLEITVGGETLEPRIQVVSTAFAYAADKLDGVDASDLEESQEILDHAVLPDAHREHATLEESAEIGTVIGTHAAAGDPHQVYVKKEGDTITGNLQLDGELTVGTTLGVIRFGPGQLIAGETGGILMKGNAPTDDLSWSSGPDATSGALRIFGEDLFQFISGNGVYSFINGAAGTPLQEVAQLDGTGSLQLDGGLTAGQNISAPAFIGDGSQLTGISVGAADSASNVVDLVLTADSDTDGTGSISLRTGASDRLTVLNTGNIGIGTSVPGEMLDVAGNVKATSFIGDATLLTGIMAGLASQSCGAGGVLKGFDGEGNFICEGGPPYCWSRLPEQSYSRC